MQKIYHTSIVMCQIELEKYYFHFSEIRKFEFIILAFDRFWFFFISFLETEGFFNFHPTLLLFCFFPGISKNFHGYIWKKNIVLGLSRSTFMELHNKYVYHNPHRWFFISDGYIIKNSENVNDNRNNKNLSFKMPNP